MIQLPHPTHFSDQTPCSSGTPNMPVLRPGKQRRSGYMSPIVCAPREQAIDSTRSEPSILSSTSLTHSFSHCLSTTSASNSCFLPSFLFFTLRAETSILTSFSPPARQMATQLLQPMTVTFLYGATISAISFRGFLFATIIAFHLRRL